MYFLIEKGGRKPSVKKKFMSRGAEAPCDAVRDYWAGSHLQRTGDTMAPSFFNAASYFVSSKPTRAPSALLASWLTA